MLTLYERKKLGFYFYAQCNILLVQNFKVVTNVQDQILLLFQTGIPSMEVQANTGKKALPW